MRVIIAIAFLVVSLTVRAQSTDKQYFDSLVKAANLKEDIDSVAVYFVNGEYFTKYMENFDQKLATIHHARIERVGYSPVKDCGYQPGKGTIYIFTKKEKVRASARKKVKAS